MHAVPHWSPNAEKGAQTHLVEIEAQACNVSAAFYEKLPQIQRSTLLARAVDQMNVPTFQKFCDAIRPELAKFKINVMAAY